MSEKLVSIIIPTLNEEENLALLLPYLSEHKGIKTEIIVADACNTDDNTKSLCNNLGVQRVVCNQCSRAAQMNKGASIAKGEILYFVHADTRPPKSFESDIRTTLSNNYDFGIFSYQFDSDSILLKINSRFTKCKGLFAGGGDQSIFMLRSTFERLGKFEVSYTIMEDFRLFHKAIREGLRYRVVPHNVIVSARKYEKNSYLRVNFSNLLAFSMYHLGMSPEKIKKTYSYLLK